MYIVGSLIKKTLAEQEPFVAHSPWLQLNTNENFWILLMVEGMVPGGKAEGDLSRWSQDNEATWGTRMTEAEGAIMRGTQDI